MTTRLVTAAALLMLSLSSQATLLIFEFGDQGTGTLFGVGDNTGYAATLDSVSLQAFGYKGVDLEDLGEDVSSSFDDTEAILRDISGGSQGLSVDSENSDADNRIDGDGPDEAIWFDLTTSGLLTAIQFDNFGGDDDFNLILDGIVTLVDIGDLDNDLWTGSLAFSHSFAIGADGVSDEFRLRSVTLDVSEPITTGLLLGLLGLGFVRHKRSET